MTTAQTIEPLLVMALAAPVAGVAVLRAAWGRPARSHPLNALGWALLLFGFGTGIAAQGAWGAAVSSLAGMAAAAIVLGWAAAVAPRGRVAASKRRVKMLPEAGEPRHIGRRIATFALVAIVAVPVAVGDAVAAWAMGTWAGVAPANAIVLGFFTLPLAWTGIAFAMLMQEGGRARGIVVAIAALPVFPLLAGASA